METALSDPALCNCFFQAMMQLDACTEPLPASALLERRALEFVQESVQELLQSLSTPGSGNVALPLESS